MWKILCCAEIGGLVIKFCGGFSPVGAWSSVCRLGQECLSALLAGAAPLESGQMMECVRVGKTWQQLEVVLGRHTRHLLSRGQDVNIECCLSMLASMLIIPPLRVWVVTAIDMWIRRRIAEETGRRLPSNWLKLDINVIPSSDDRWEVWRAACCDDDPEQEVPSNIMVLIAEVIQNVVAVN